MELGKLIVPSGFGNDVSKCKKKRTGINCTVVFLIVESWQKKCNNKNNFGKRKKRAIHQKI